MTVRRRARRTTLLPSPAAFVAVALLCNACQGRPTTVGEFLHAHSITWRTGDTVQPPPRTPYRGGPVWVTTRAVLALAAPRHTVWDPTLLRGQVVLLRSGAPGSVVVRTTRRIDPDGRVTTVRVQRRLLVPPRAAWVRCGSAVPRFLIRQGVRYRYRAVLTMVATAYNASRAQNGPWGAVARDGRALTRGMAAVDPGVIPLGTRLFVQGYGPALAADTGNAIRGRRIDLFFDRSDAATAAFGVRTVKVYVLA
jgi:3D (Asp-Asp-Asp) domain-containing protein